MTRNILVIPACCCIDVQRRGEKKERTLDSIVFVSTHSFTPGPACWPESLTPFFVCPSGPLKPVLKSPVCHTRLHRYQEIPGLWNPRRVATCQREGPGCSLVQSYLGGGFQQCFTVTYLVSSVASTKGPVRSLGTNIRGHFQLVGC